MSAVVGFGSYLSCIAERLTDRSVCSLQLLWY